MIKDSVIWGITTAIVLVIDTQKRAEDNRLFRKILFDNLNLLVALEFISNCFTFSLPFELILVPSVTFLLVLRTYMEAKNNLTLEKGFLDTILGTLGLVFLVFTSLKLLGELPAFANLENLKTFLLAPALTIALIPFIYFLALLMKYEAIFLRIELRLRFKKRLASELKWRVFVSCFVRLGKLIYFSRTFHHRIDKNNPDIPTLMRQFEFDWKKGVSFNPPSVVC